MASFLHEPNADVAYILYIVDPAVVSAFVGYLKPLEHAHHAHRLVEFRHALPENILYVYVVLQILRQLNVLGLRLFW